MTYRSKSFPWYTQHTVPNGKTKKKALLVFLHVRYVPCVWLVDWHWFDDDDVEQNNRSKRAERCTFVRRYCICGHDCDFKYVVISNVPTNHYYCTHTHTPSATHNQPEPIYYDDIKLATVCIFSPFFLFYWIFFPFYRIFIWIKFYVAWRKGLM